jgi:hypothetical protein
MTQLVHLQDACVIYMHVVAVYEWMFVRSIHLILHSIQSFGVFDAFLIHLCSQKMLANPY